MMDPAVLGYLSHVQKEGELIDQQLQNGELSHPFNSGAQMAMQAARNSIGISPNQRESAFNRAIMNFGRAMGRPYRNKIEAFSEALGHGSDAYFAEKDRQEHMNAALYAQALQQQQQALERHRHMQEAEKNRELHRQQMEMQREYHNAQIAEQKRSHDLMNQYRMDSLGVRRELGKGKNIPSAINLEGISESPSFKGKYGVEYIPFDNQKEFNNYWADKSEASQEVKNLGINKKAKHVLGEMRKIIKQHPDVGSSYLNLLTGDEKGQSWMQLMMRNNPFMDKKKLHAIESLEKLGSELRYDLVKSMPGSKGTDLVKRLIDKASASGKTLSETTNYVIDETDKTIDDNIKRIEVYEDARRHKMRPLFTTMDELNEDQEDIDERPSDFSSSKTVKIKDPSGKVWEIPSENLQSAIQRGAVPVE